MCSFRLQCQILLQVFHMSLVLHKKHSRESVCGMNDSKEKRKKSFYIYLSFKYSLFFPCFFYNGIYRIGVRLAALGQKLFCVNQLLGFAGLEQALNGGMCTDSQNYYWCCSPRRPRKFHSPVFKENSICKDVLTHANQLCV